MGLFSHHAKQQPPKYMDLGLPGDPKFQAMRARGLSPFLMNALSKINLVPGAMGPVPSGGRGGMAAPGAAPPPFPEPTRAVAGGGVR